MDDSLKEKPWMKIALLLAGIFNAVTGLSMIFVPAATLSLFEFGGSSITTVPWRMLGMADFCLGFAYLVASRAPFKNQSLITIGLISDILCSAFLVVNLSSWSASLTGIGLLVVLRIGYWIPLFVVAWNAYRVSSCQSTMHVKEDYDDPVRELLLNDGSNIEGRSMEQPQLVVFLRHAGCTFCRESLTRLAKQRAKIEDSNCGIILVHLGQEESAAKFFEKYGLSDVPRVPDPQCRLYRQFGLDLGSFGGLFGPKVWFRGIIAGVFQGHGIGKAEGNVFQMPGAFVIYMGRFVRGLRPASASEPLNYLSLVEESVEKISSSTCATEV